MATKKGKKARKQLSTLLIKDHQENLAKSKDKEVTLSDDDHLFQLIRGVPTEMISRGGDEGVDYKPLKQKSISSVDTDRDEMKKNPITSRSQAWKRESPVDFVVTLMMTSDGNEPPDGGGSCKFGPVESPAESPRRASSESDSSSEDSSSSDSSGSAEEQARSSGQSNFSVGQSNLHESSSTNEKQKEPIKGILKSKTLKPNVTGQSNFSVGQSNFSVGQSNSEKTIFLSF
jgi:hypothetical protein